MPHAIARLSEQGHSSGVVSGGDSLQGATGACYLSSSWGVWVMCNVEVLTEGYDCRWQDGNPHLSGVAWDGTAGETVTWLRVYRKSRSVQ